MENHVTRPGWFSRNWKWAVPLGCFGAIATFVAFIAAIVVVVMGAMRTSDVYQIAMSRAREHPAVVEAIVADKIADEWVFERLEVEVAGAAERVNLLDEVTDGKS